MARDDFNYIEFKILAYYYAWLKGKVVFDDQVLREVTKGADDPYFYKELKSLSDRSYLEGLTFINAWGNEFFVGNDLSDGAITAEGYRYLKENSSMKGALEYAKTAGDLISTLLPKIF